MRKLAMPDRMAVLGDLEIPPQNSMEVLKKDRSGQHSIRTVDQRQLYFRWMPAGLENVEIVDHHCIKCLL